jgi:hypothetical protein
MFEILSRSPKWYVVRYQHLIKQNFCQACGSKKSLQVHHIVPFSVDPSKELDKDNLITLCKSCHLVFGHLMDWRSWNTEVINDSMVYYNKIINKPYRIKGQADDKNFIGIFFSFIWRSIFFWDYRP